MIQFFSLCVINHINSKLEQPVEVFLKDSNDSQNAIAFQHKTGVIYWVLGADIETNLFTLQSVYLDTDYNQEFDETENYGTLKQAIGKMLYQINQLRD